MRQRTLQILFLLGMAVVGFSLMSHKQARADIMPAQPVQPVLPALPGQTAAASPVSHLVSRLIANPAPRPVVGKLMSRLTQPKSFKKIAPSVNLDPPTKLPSITRASGGNSPDGDNLANLALGQQMAADRGWTGPAWTCLRALWTHESHWQTTDGTPKYAYGIPQSDPGKKMAAYGGDWLTNPRVQIAWGLDYLAGRYKEPCTALAHWKAHNWE